MQSVDIVNRLIEVISNYTDDFNTSFNVSSLTSSGTTATCVTDSAHGLTTGDYVTIKGATNPITITSLTRSGNIATAVTSEATQLSDPSKYAKGDRNSLTVTISGADPVGYNGTWQLLSVTDDRKTFTFNVTGAPTTPAATAGFFLQADFDGYNGYKQVTVIDATTFTYTLPTTLNSPSQGTITCFTDTRIEAAATVERVEEFYSGNSNNNLQKYIFVVMGSKVVYKDGTVASDITAAKYAPEQYRFDATQDFSVYIYIPTEDDLLGNVAADQARAYEYAILKALANYQLPSSLSEECYQPINYIGNEEDNYNTAYYIHRFDFTARSIIQQADVYDGVQGVPLEEIDGEFTDKDLEFNPKFRT